MPEEERIQKTSQTMKKTFTGTLDSGNNGLPPKINPADYTISTTNQVIANQSSNTTPSTQGSSDSD